MTKEASLKDFSRNEAEFVQRLTEGQVSNSEILRICEQAMDVFASEPLLLELSSDITVVGDIHGQFFDLLKILAVAPSEQYLFLGDFVDRGANSMETIVLLLYMKGKYPEKVWILRGNHESMKTSSNYGFMDECVRMHRSKLLWYKICQVFEFMPICGIIDRKIFAVHAGISPELRLEELNEIVRVGDVPNKGVLADLLWSDPKEETDGFSPSSRGVGYYFGESEVNKFLESARLEKIIRSHQLVEDGWKEEFDGKVITIWSAPNYCYRCMNKAAVAKITKEGVEYCEVPVSEQQRRETKPLQYFL
ncbi:uncharacterized protein NEMAJ01_0754 [Nematocida major]|uniref:uncharacterized protein n=1 Tax=Nematocida major TaxID=1912982 RepID=UPI00200865F1|nr:uncharacterized protein NEMAJ01_0754 [Nematocida major]KAH9385858.1 hypothetical protein NEMAJ01_0754 [Nematocida major]